MLTDSGAGAWDLLRAKDMLSQGAEPPPRGLLLSGHAPKCHPRLINLPLEDL